MFKVYAAHEGRSDDVFLCEVGTLEEADAVIRILEQRWNDWMNTPDWDVNRPKDQRVAEMEGSSIYAKDEDGSLWLELGPDVPWERG